MGGGEAARHPMIGSMVSRRWYDISRRVGAFESRFFTMVNVVVVVVVVVLVGVCFLPTQRPHILVKMLTHTDGGGDGARKLALPIPLRGPRIAARMVSCMGSYV